MSTFTRLKTTITQELLLEWLVIWPEKKQENWAIRWKQLVGNWVIHPPSPPSVKNFTQMFPFFVGDPSEATTVSMNMIFKKTCMMFFLLYLLETAYHGPCYNIYIIFIFTSNSGWRLHEEVNAGSALPEQSLYSHPSGKLSDNWGWQEGLELMTIGAACLYPKRVTSSGFPPKCFIFCCNHFRAAIWGTILIFIIWPSFVFTGILATTWFSLYNTWSMSP